MNINIIVAASENNVIGVDNRLPWHLPADLKYFKQLTTGHAIIMGRKTFDSIGKPLPNRRNLVITKSKTFSHEGITVVNSIDNAIEACETEENVFVIGGETIYAQMLSITHQIYLTRVHVKVENGTAFFPSLNPDEWELTSSDAHTKDEKNAWAYTFEVYKRRTA